MRIKLQEEFPAGSSTLVTDTAKLSRQGIELRIEDQTTGAEITGIEIGNPDNEDQL